MKRLLTHALRGNRARKTLTHREARISGQRKTVVGADCGIPAARHGPVLASGALSDEQPIPEQVRPHLDRGGRERWPRARKEALDTRF